ncbi:VOC family protein [Micromonospora endophytica]|uniref:VOC family protein n=1 Tax=Micromonospora endophytica TaxID=515350 RepID=UPI001C337BAA|nr:VOC family protein [Micromonospora endophytica]BCJ62118.1 hypothetical protein Jiend_55400 [Micromonospora endophytica]
MAEPADVGLLGGQTFLAVTGRDDAGRDDAAWVALLTRRARTEGGTPRGGLRPDPLEIDTVNSSEQSTSPPVRQLRLVVEADDYEAAVAFYRDVLGLPEQAAFSSGDEARVVILDAGRATLEIANPAQKRMIDDVEVGRQVAPRLRVAFEVEDTAGTTDRLVAAGATQVAPPTTTPWQSVNARLDAPAGLHITLFQELRTLDERTTLDGFGTNPTHS